MICPSCRAENADSATACVRCGAALVATAASPTAPTAVMVTMDLSPGVVFHSRYEILETLGRGGMGMVFKAHDRTLDETVAIKVLRPDFAQDPKMAARFKSEIKLARKVRHKNVCTIHDFGEDHGLLFISMEPIGGTDLKKVLTEKGGLPMGQAYDLAIQIAEGLQAVHEAGIIHRDLKAPNIMIEPSGVARLMDFGIAKQEGVDGTMTATGHIVGTPDYMSPEQAQGLKLDFRSDIYALGIVTWEIFTGHVPFRGETPISTILKHINEPPPLDGPEASKLPGPLRPALRKALAKNPAERFATARDFAEALRDARSPSRRQQPIHTEALCAPTMAVTPAPAPRRRAWVLAAPAVLVLGFVGWLATRGAPPTEGPATPSPVVQPSAPPTATERATALSETATRPEGGQPAASVSGPVVQAAATRAAPAVEPRQTPRPAVTTAPRVIPAPPAGRRPTPAAPTPTPAAAPPSGVPSGGASLSREPAAEPRGAGLLHVVVRPWGEVTVDGKVVGTTPFPDLPLTAGRHVVRVRHPAYQPLEREVTVQSEQTTRLAIDFSTEGVRK